jgi:hypothetical protein
LTDGSQQLASVWAEKDSKSKRNVVKKVIAYMTLGLDVSRMYPEMVKVRRDSTRGTFGGHPSPVRSAAGLARTL